LAALVDGIVAKAPCEESIYFLTGDAVTPASQVLHASHPAVLGTQTNGFEKLKLNLADLDGDQRARLYYAIRKWGPHVQIDPRIQSQMIGSTVLQAPQYTQLWFDLLTDNMPRKRKQALSAGDKLHGGSLT